MIRPHTPHDLEIVRKFKEALEIAAREKMTTGRVALWLWQIMRAEYTSQQHKS